MLLCVQLLVISTIVALFFPLQLYLAALGIPERAAGFIIGADALAALAVQPLIAPLVSARNARKWLIAGSLVLAGSLLTEGLVSDAWAFTAARLLQGAGFICVMTAFMPLLVLCIPGDRSGQAFGWISMIRLVPYAAVPPLFSLWGVAAADFGLVIRWSALLGIAPALILMCIPVLNGEKDSPDASPLMDILRSLRDRRLCCLLASTLLTYSSYAITFFFLKGLLGQSGLTHGGFFFTLATLVMLVVRLTGGVFFDRYNKVRMAAGALILSAAAIAALPLCASMDVLLVTAVVCGIGWGIGMPLLNAIAFVISPPEARGLNQNLVFLMLQAGFFLGPLLGGVLLDQSGYDLLFWAGSALMVPAALLVFAAGLFHEQ
jgi:MFS family permease